MSNEELKIDIILESFIYKDNLKKLGHSIGIIDHIISPDEERYVMRYPIGFKSRDNKVSGNIDFGMMIKHKIINKEVRDFKLSYLEKSILTNFKCDGEKEWCKSVEKYLTE